MRTSIKLGAMACVASLLFMSTRPVEAAVTHSVATAAMETSADSFTAGALAGAVVGGAVAGAVSGAVVAAFGTPAITVSAIAGGIGGAIGGAAGYLVSSVFGSEISPIEMLPVPETALD